ncbi:hypothetical protein CDD81_2980 [Ophiocordyceps australis]|uniref:FAD-binding domain-containing protein n=1 Tax=Ophiocordyceps australis TaxID=1399860 RepID=A0A2C5YJV9_9HYPO|nr:hypothetical protein CDD81_2980 [Ophiocordyceps australis]
MERDKAIEILYNNLRNKNQVLTAQRITKVEHLADKVRLHAASGDTFDAHVVIGADGTHSVIRRDMCDMMEKWLPAKQTRAPITIKTEYGCIFGMSRPTGDLRATHAHLVHKKHVSITCLGGPGDRLYWFLFFKLPRAHLGHDYPQCSKADERALVAQEAETRLTPSVCFKQLHDNLILCRTTPLPQYLVAEWHYRRIMLLGDSAHKLHPLTGQGGNLALEAAAALADCLWNALKDGHGSPSAQQIDSAFSHAQQLCQQRAARLVESSFQEYRMASWANKAYEIMDCYLVPHLDTPMLVDRISSYIVGGYQSQCIVGKSNKAPPTHCIPYYNELAHKPALHSSQLLYIVAGYLVLLSMAVHVANRLPRVCELAAALPHQQHVGSLDYAPLLDACSSSLYAFFSAAGWNPTYRLLIFYSFASQSLVFATWTMESCRPRSSIKPIALVLLVEFLAHFSALRIMVPILYLIDNMTTVLSSQWWPTATFVTPAKAKRVLPACVIGLFLPLLLMLNPLSPSYLRHALTVMYMACPVWLYLCKTCPLHTIPEQTYSQLAAPQSVAHIRQLYTTLAMMTGLVYMGTVASILASVDAGSRLQNVLEVLWFPSCRTADLYQQAHMLLLWRLYTSAVPLLLWNFYSSLAASR